MGLRSALLFELSRRGLSKPSTRSVDYGVYQDWRRTHLAASWSAFAACDLRGKQVLDFGCGDGPLSLYLAHHHSPARIIGVDLDPIAVGRARAALAQRPGPPEVMVDFRQGAVDRIPLEDGSVDVVVAFDCLEHVMDPPSILREWRRVLRPGGRCLLEWFPYKGPWGPHMESLIPVPWAHVLFGQRAMFRAAERIYDLPEFVPRHWDLDAEGRKRPNKWRQWSSFKQQGYINELDVASLRRMVPQAGLQIARLERRSFSGSAMRRTLGKALMAMPVVGEYFVSYTCIELVRP